ncbi:hypothetical protein A3K69_07695 [Candidatus Bathyarchaeota archaeon RBG_16_57_9]|nr:MAG: hypothetical protein A3K69_07695 [Candidatus Bathyarchaeota archaeon RBG_16_57_9]
MEPLFLVVDVGSSGVKAFLVDAAGGIVTRAESPWERDRWLADSGWCSIIQAVRDAIGDRKLIQDSLRAVSVTSMREEFVLLDGSGSEVKAELNEESYRFGERIVEEHGELMYDLSGHWPVPNWIAGAVLPWMRAECSGFREARRFLMMADWVVYKLSGVACTEGSNACETSMYDVYRNDWAWELIDDLLLPRGIFPPVKRSGEALGTVTREASKDTGIPTDALVVTGGADTQCGLMGMGAQPGEAGAVGGTTTPVLTVTSNPVIDPRRRLWSNIHVEAGLWTLESNAGFTGRNMRWLRDLMGTGSYEYLNHEAGLVPPGSDGLLTFLGAHVFDSGPPYWKQDRLGDRNVPPTVMGKHDFSSGELARSIMESSCYAVKANLEQLEEASGARFSSLKFCGGNSKSALWTQMQSDVLGVPVVTPVISEGTAVGAAALAAVGSGVYSDIREAVEAMVRLKKPVAPDPGRSETYSRLYRDWMATRERLHGTL